jgi:hypothetical protein
MGDGRLGHVDLLGQVWEWSSSAFRPYPYVATDGREDLYSPERRVLKGGCWGDGKYANRVTTRYHYTPLYSDVTTGFRLAADGDGRPWSPRPAFDLVVYGRSSFCADLVDGKQWLHDWNVPYRQINIDLDEQAGFRLDDWIGNRTIPTYVVAERGSSVPILPPKEVDLSHLRDANRGTMLHEADRSTLRAWLIQNGLLAE